MVEAAFRKEVSKTREAGEVVGEEDEILIYIKALGEVGKKKPAPSREKQRDTEKKKDTPHEKRQESKREEKQSSSSQRFMKPGSENKNKSSCQGKISLEGLNMAEKRVTIQKALDEVPPFIVSRIKTKQKAALAKLKSDGKQVNEAEEQECLAEAFNHMFNEEGNVMAHVLRDHVFKKTGDYHIKRDAAVKQLQLPQYDDQVKKFKKLEEAEQIKEMKDRRESLSVLLKIWLFKEQDKVFEDAVKAGVELSKNEKNIIRYQILLDLSHAVFKKQDEKAAPNAANTRTDVGYEAEREASGSDEFDDDVDHTQGGKRRRRSASVEIVQKKARKEDETVIEISDDEDSLQEELTQGENSNKQKPNETDNGAV